MQTTVSHTAFGGDDHRTENANVLFSGTQLDQLRAQIGVYKFLKTSGPLPDNLLRASEGIGNIKPEVEEEIQRHIQEIRNNRIVSRNRIAPIDSHMPLDPIIILKERDARLQARVTQRILELASMSVNVDNSIRTKLQMELRSLRLLNLQRSLRKEVLNATKKDTTLDMSLNVRAYRRPKKMPLRESRFTESLERRRRLELERKRRQRHHAFLNAVMSHCKEFRDYHRSRLSRINKTNKALINYMNNCERDKRKEQERLTRERIRRLMAEDEEGYRKMIDKEKNQRLHYLLSQTDEFIRNLTKLVRDHKKKFTLQQRDERREKRRLARERCDKLMTELSQSAYGLLPPSLTEGQRVPVIHASTKEVLTGNEAPLATDIAQWLDNNMGWELALTDEHGEIIPESDNENPIEEEDDDIDDGPVMAEDDEYNKNSIQQTYYTNAHSVREEVKEQASIMVHGRLKEYQLKGLEWMVSLYNNSLNGILADEMGLGKTIQTIALFTYLMEKKRVSGPFCVIMPLSTLSNWAMEFDRWAPSVKKIIYRGSPAARRELQSQFRSSLFNVMLTTYEYAIKDKAVLSKLQWKVLVVDEGHRMKNHHCKLTQVLTKHYSAPHRILLTGTPLQNKLPELWALLNFLLPHIFHSCVTFEQWFNAPFAQTGEKVELNHEETVLIIRRLHKVLRPFLLRRLKKEVESQLPDKVEYVVKCEMSALQQALYQHMQSKGVILTDGSEKEKKGKGGTRTLMNTLMQLRKICNHPFIFSHIEKAIAEHQRPDVEGPITHVEGPDLFRASGKFELLDRILPKLKAREHRVLIFCQMTSLMTIMQDYFDYRNYRYLRLDGTTRSDERGDLLAKFNDDKEDYFIFLLSTRAGGLGLNLQTADTVILFDSDWNPHQDLQAQDRAHRIGQTKEVRVLRFITINSVEEKILAAARYKLNVDEKVIQAGKFDQKSTGSERREFLQALLEQDTVDDEECDAAPDDETINQMLARTEEEFELYQQIDAEREEAERLAAKGKTPRSRLMAEDELPSWILRDDEEVERSLNEQLFSGSAAHGKRIRKEIDYSDHMTEKEWLKAVDEGRLEEARLQAASKRPSSRRRKSRLTNDDASSTGGCQIDVDENTMDSCSMDASTSNATAPASTSSRKRTRVTATAVSFSDDIESTTQQSSGGATTFSPQAKAVIHRMERLMDVMIKYQDRDGRVLSEPFRKLPTRKELPDYYELIDQPTDLNRIRRRVRLGKYHNMDMLNSDMKLLFDNARSYNMDGSLIYEDSIVLESVWKQACARFDQEEGPLQSLKPEEFAVPVTTNAGQGTCETETSDIVDPDSGVRPKAKRQRRKPQKLLDQDHFEAGNYIDEYDSESSKKKQRSAPYKSRKSRGSLPSASPSEVEAPSTTVQTEQDDLTSRNINETIESVLLQINNLVSGAEVGELRESETTRPQPAVSSACLDDSGDDEDEETDAEEAESRDSLSFQ